MELIASDKFRRRTNQIKSNEEQQQRERKKIKRSLRCSVAEEIYDDGWRFWFFWSKLGSRRK